MGGPPGVGDEAAAVLAWGAEALAIGDGAGAFEAAVAFKKVGKAGGEGGFGRAFIFGFEMEALEFVLNS